MPLQHSRFSIVALLRWLCLLTALVAVLPPASAGAQWPITKLMNVKVLPSDISVAAVIDTMKAFTRALGVRCTYCHVGKEGEPLNTYDFASDEKPEKVKAREMLRMVSAINGDHLSKLVARREPSISVQCATCHHGVAQPRPIQQVLQMAYDGGGVDSVDTVYRSLRRRYYGSAAYDFGEVPLTRLGEALIARNKQADAMRMYLLNVEMLPNSVFALWQAGAAQGVAGDTAGAVATLRKALAINPNHEGVLTLLKQLGQKP